MLPDRLEPPPGAEEGAQSGWVPSVRAGHADREQVIEALKDAFVR
jgi:hypothetical protein